MKTTLAARLIFLFCLCMYMTALPSAASAEPKFAVVDVQKILNESTAGKKAKADLETLIKSKQNLIDEKGKSIEKLKSEIEKQSSVLSAEARKGKEEDLEKLVREYQRLVQDSQADIKKKEGELTESILREIHELIEQTGEENYTLILEKGMVIHASKGIDITDSILKEFDALKAKPKK
jgi:outer membrane protein